MALDHLITEKDNQTVCPVRVATLITGVLYHGAAAYGFWSHSLSVDINTLGQYMQHMMLLVGVGGTAVGVKSLMKADAS